MKKHYSDDEYGEKGICGHYSEHLEDDWIFVNCKKCLKAKDAYIEQCKIDLEIQCNQMGDMADFFNKEGRWKPTK